MKFAVIQIPAFLCRQTDLVSAAAKTSSAIQFKSHNFLSATEMKNVIEKCKSAEMKKLFYAREEIFLVITIL